MNRPSTDPSGQAMSFAVLSTDAERVSEQRNESPPGILVAIPDNRILRAVERTVFALGAKPIGASSLREARDILDRIEVSLVLCSAHLPDGTFHELLPTVHWKGAGMVVVCKGACSSGTRIDALELGILDYISYPLSEEELQWVVQNALARRLRGKTMATGLR